ncbi:unnamed protein product [Hymenolepis diminuta]|uniref:Ribosome-recycling factor, mitochondrial n=1 Tax=Hymenolepis diminuta TaxID=6216 RepID=A0A0R3SV46_HYMDI|nr:unnamed protein product [Hymenolepis diminuta]VUZ54564.1 unnamed protein product [Hymenolepis diminuta]
MISAVFNKFWVTSGVRYVSMSRTALADIVSSLSNFTAEPQKLRNVQPLILPVRFKSKNKVRKDTAKLISLTEELKQAIKVEDMSQDYLKLMDRFEDSLYGKLCLKLTPELFYTIPIPSERVQLGDVATIVSQTTSQSTNIQPTSEILIDLSGRPDLVPAAKAAVSQYLSSDSDASISKKGRANSSNSDLIQDVDQTQFTVRLRTVVTGDVRNELTRRGRDMLHQTKKDMDKVYQKYSKLVTSMSALSEDDKRVANEYLKSTVKAQHVKAEQAWKAKEQELLSDQT